MLSLSCSSLTFKMPLYTEGKGHWLAQQDSGHITTSSEAFLPLWFQVLSGWSTFTIILPLPSHWFMHECNRQTLYLHIRPFPQSNKHPRSQLKAELWNMTAVFKRFSSGLGQCFEVGVSKPQLRFLKVDAVISNTHLGLGSESLISSTFLAVMGLGLGGWLGSDGQGEGGSLLGRRGLSSRVMGHRPLVVG